MSIVLIFQIQPPFTIKSPVKWLNHFEIYLHFMFVFVDR